MPWMNLIVLAATMTASFSLGWLSAKAWYRPIKDLKTLTYQNGKLKLQNNERAIKG
jgi:hypothetical protein